MSQRRSEPKARPAADPALVIANPHAAGVDVHAREHWACVPAGSAPPPPPGYHRAMIRIREILDPELRAQILEKLAEQRGTSVAAIPDWFELDDLDYVDLLNDLKEAELGADDSSHDPRM